MAASSAIRIRVARADEAEALSALTMRSKAHWGYDQTFLDACADELRIDAAALEDANQVWRVAIAGQRIAGVYGLVPVDARRVELVALFVDPGAIGTGVGAGLVSDAVRQAQARRFDHMIIQGDPHATGFYLAMGAVRAGERESGSISGRFLPLFELDVRQPQSASIEETRK